MAKMVLKWAGIVMAALVALVGAYAAYVMLSYYRLDDNLPLEEGQRITSYVLPEAIDLAASPELAAVTANLGFGAYGPDSRIGRTAAVMLGSTETTFYVLAVYFGACGVRRSRWAIPAAIAADLTGFLVAAALVRWIWGA